MLSKEAGYDAFLAEKIRKGREDIKAGRLVSQEAFEQQMQQVLRHLEQEQRVQEQSLGGTVEWALAHQ